MLRRSMLSLAIFAVSFVMCKAQCSIHLYQCRSCGANSQGTSNPKPGNYCSGRDKPSYGHQWQDQGLIPECARQKKEAEEKDARDREIQCEKNKIRVYKGGKVEDWYCPSGKAAEVIFQDGHVEYYDYTGDLEKKKVPETNGHFVTTYRRGNIESKGLLNKNGLPDGEWFYKSGIIYVEDYKIEVACIKCTVTYKLGNVKGIKDSLGNDVLKERSEQIKNEIKRRDFFKDEEEDFKYAMSKYKYGNKYLGDTSALHDYLKKYYPNQDIAKEIKENPEYKEYNIGRAYYAVKYKADTDAYLSIKTIYDRYLYVTKFPNGLYKNNVESDLRLYAENTEELMDNAKKYLLSKEYNKSIINQDIFAYLNTNIGNNIYLKTSIYCSLAFWASGKKDEAVNIVKDRTGHAIPYSDGSKLKYVDDYLNTYKAFKDQLGISEDKETLNKIKALRK